MIVVPEQGQVDLGRSRIQPRETYAGAPVQRDGGGGGLDDLAKALSGLAGISADHEKTKEAEDMKRLDYYTNHAQGILKDVNEGGPIQAQLGNILPEVSPTVRTRVAEQIGIDRGRAWIASQFETLHSDPAADMDPAATEARLNALRAQAREMVKDQPDYGNGFVRAVEAELAQFSQQKSATRNGFFQQKQAEGYTQSAIEAAEKGQAGTQVQWRTVDTQPDRYQNLSKVLAKGKSFEHVGKLKADFGDRLEKMVSEAPPEVRSGLSVISGFRSVDRQREIFEDAVKKYGSEQAARKWAAPPGKSNHNHGEAVDLRFASDATKKWVHENAERYGLYFPMKHEPWHVEMRGGRREGAPNHRPDVASSDGEDITPDAKSAYMRRMFGAESSFNPGAQNSQTSAGGLAQFVDKTWLQEAREVNPALRGRSDAEVIRMKTDTSEAGVAFHKKVAEGFTDRNIKRLEDAGLPVTEANLYLLHFAGEGGGPKIIKARGGTRIEDLLSRDAVEANNLGGMTAAEVREWAAEKMGNATNGVSRARNAIRATDREWGVSSSLTNQYRAELASKGLQQRAIQTMDPSYLDMVPPELITPAMRSEIQATRRQVMDLQDREFQRQRTRRIQAEQDQANVMIDEINADLAAGKDIDPRKYYTNSTAFSYARQQEGVNMRVSEVDSKANAMIVRNDILGFGTTNDSKLLESYPDLKAKAERGEALGLRDFLDAVRNDPRLRSSEKNAILADMPRLMEGAAVLRDPVITEAYTSRVFNIAKLTEADMTFQQVAKVTGLDLSGEIKKVYQNSVKRQILGHYSQYGQKPNEGQLDMMIDKAVTESLALHKSLVDIVKTQNIKGAQAIQGNIATQNTTEKGQAPADTGTGNSAPVAPKEALASVQKALPPGYKAVMRPDGKIEAVKEAQPGSDPVDLTFGDAIGNTPGRGLSITISPDIVDSVTKSITGRE
jgi:hypothetical protein